MIQRGQDILSTTRDAASGFVSAQLGDVTAGTGDDTPGEALSQEADIWQHWGFCSRPATPVAGMSAAQAVVVLTSDYDVVIAGRDSRCAAMYGALKDGETAVFASTGQARALFKADGSITLVTTSDNTAAGTTISMRISSDGLVFSAPWGGFSFTSQGFQAFTQTTGVSPVFKGSFEVKSDGKCVAVGTQFSAVCSQVSLGIGATVATPVCVGPAGTSAVGSHSVFAAP